VSTFRPAGKYVYCVTSPHFSRGGRRVTEGIECMKGFVTKRETGCFQDTPIPALACSRALALVLHSSGSYGCIASRGGRGAPTRSGGDLTPGEAMTRSGSRSDVPPTGGRIPGCAGGPALRLERVRRSRTASKHTSPAPASGIPVRNAG